MRQAFRGAQSRPFRRRLKLPPGRKHIKKGAPQNCRCEIRCAFFRYTLVCPPQSGEQQPPAMRIFILRLYKKRPPATDLQSAALNCTQSLSGRSKPPFSAALKIAAGRNHIKKVRRKIAAAKYGALFSVIIFIQNPSMPAPIIPALLPREAFITLGGSTLSWE